MDKSGYMMFTATKYNLHFLLKLGCSTLVANAVFLFLSGIFTVIFFCQDKKAIFSQRIKLTSQKPAMLKMACENDFSAALEFCLTILSSN